MFCLWWGRCLSLSHHDFPHSTGPWFDAVTANATFIARPDVTPNLAYCSHSAHLCLFCPEAWARHDHPGPAGTPSRPTVAVTGPWEREAGLARGPAGAERACVACDRHPGVPPPPLPLFPSRHTHCFLTQQQLAPFELSCLVIN